MSIAEKRERCRDLQAQLAVVKGEAPNPSEVTGALASELENLATLYATLIERLPVLAALTQTVLVRQLNVDDVLQNASAQAKQIEGMGFRSVPFAKETMTYMNKVATTARIAEQWLQYDVSERLTRDFLGNANASVNPSFLALLDLYGKRKDDVDAMLVEAKRRYELKQRLHEAQQVLDTPMAQRVDPISAASATQSYEGVVAQLAAIIEQVEPHMFSLDQSAAALATEATDVKTLLAYFCECMRLCADTAAAAARLGPVWMPVDPVAALASMEGLKLFTEKATFRDLLQKQDEIVPALFVLREANAKVSALHHDILITFPRLRLLSMSDVEACIGASAANGGAGNALLNGLVLQTCFCGWQSLEYQDGVDGQSYVTAVVGESGETLRLLRPVLCDRRVRADVCLSKVHLAAQETLYAELETGAKHAHNVVIGASLFDLAKLQSMTCQSALTTLRILWTSLAEGAFSKTNGGCAGGAHQDLTSPSRQTTRDHGGRSPSAAALSMPQSPVSSEYATASSSLVNQSLSAARPYMTSTSRPASGATQRVAAITKLSASNVVASLEPRPGSASPNIFKKPRDNEPATPAGVTKKGTAAAKKGAAGTKDAVESSPSPLAARKGGSALQLKSDEDVDLSDLLVADTAASIVAPMLATCPTRDRVLSSHYTARDVVPLMWGVLKQIVDAKAQHHPSRAWWFDRLSELVYPLLCAYDERVQRLVAGDAAWHREPRAYSSRGKFSFELGPLAMECEHEFYGYMREEFVLTPLVHEACCKVATGFCMERPTCILGDGGALAMPSSSPVEGATHIASALGAMSGQFVSVLRCTASTTMDDLLQFLAAQAFFPSLAIVRDLHRLTPVVQAQLSRYREAQDPSVQQGGMADRVVFVGGTEPSELHPSLQQATRFCFVNLEDDLGFSLHVWLASHGFPPSDIAAMAQRLAVLSSMMWSVCSVRIPAHAIRRSVGAAGKALLRDGVSVTADSALFHAVHTELAPLVPAQHISFFELVGRGLFAADANITFFPQVVEAAYACIREEGLDAAADGIVQRVIALHSAVSRAAVSRSVVCVVGPSKSGKSTLLRMLQRVFGCLCLDNHEPPTLLELQATDDDAVLLPQVLKWFSDAAASPQRPMWIRIKGILTAQVRTTIADALSNAMDPARTSTAATPVFFVESESIHTCTVTCWPRCLTVQVTSDATPAGWLPAVRHMVVALGQPVAGGANSMVDPAAAAAIEDVFLQHFEDALTFSFASRREGAAVIPFSRMVHNTVVLFQSMLSLHAERRTQDADGTRDGTSYASAASSASLPLHLIERVFWFACTWGCASDRSRCGWNAFVSARLSPDAAVFGGCPNSTTTTTLIPSRCGLRPADLAWVPWVELAAVIPEMTRNAAACRVLWPTANLVAAFFLAHLYMQCGNHHIGICGPPASGKTLLAMALLPPGPHVLPQQHTAVPRALARAEHHAALDNDGGTILDGCVRSDACCTLITNALACSSGTRVLYVTQTAELVVAQCPCVFTEWELEEADESVVAGGDRVDDDLSRIHHPVWMADMFYNQHSSMATFVSAIPTLAKALDKVPLLGFAAPHVWSSARHIIKMMEGGHTTDYYGAMLLQHWLQRCDTQAQVAALNDTFENVFGVTGNATAVHAATIFIRDNETSTLAAVPEEQAVAWMKDAVAATTTLSMSSTRRIAAMYFALSAAHAGLMVMAPTDVEGSGMVGNVSDELSAVAALLHTELVRLPATRGAIPDALQAATAAASIYLVEATHVYDVDDVLALEQAVLRGIRVVVLAVHAGSAPLRRCLTQTLAPKCHKVVVRATLDDIESIAAACMADKHTARSVAKMVFVCASSPSLATSMSTRAFHDGVAHFDDDRLEMERELNDKVHRASDVVKFLRRVELAVAGKAAMSVAEQQYEVAGEETSNRALEGRIEFLQVPSKAVRLIAQFTINFDDARLQEVSGPSVFFGTTREDVVAIPAVNGGTCRARCDGKGLLITTGILDFQLQPASLQPLALEGTVTDPASGHSVVGKVRLEQVIEGENVYNKKWLRYGQDAFHNDERTLMKPEELPSDELLRMSRMEAERYVSRVGSMAKTLQGQLELTVLQNVYRESCEVPKYLAGRTLLPLLLQLSLEERDAVVAQARQGSLAIESPIGLKGLAVLLRTNVYELELWLVEERRLGLPYGFLAEQNACGLRHYLECAQRGAEDADAGDQSDALRPIVVVDDDPLMSQWVEGYCARLHIPCVRAEHPLHVGSEDAEDLQTVQIVRTVTPADKAALHVLATKHTTGSLTSLYQMTIARPASGSTTETAIAATLSAAVKAQQTLDEALGELLEVLHTQFEVSEAEASVVAAIVEIGKEKIPNLMEAIRKTKELLSAADAYVDRSGNRWKSTMENALPHAKRVAVLHVATLSILPTLSPSYVFTNGFAQSVVLEALSASGKSVVEIATRKFCAPVVAMLRLEHRLAFCTCLGALVLQDTALPPLNEAMRLLREVNPREHILRERQLKLDAVAAFDLHKNTPTQHAAAGSGKAVKSAAMQQQQQKKELKDFLSPLIKPPYPFLTYAMWVQLLALSNSLPAWTNLPASMQPSDVPLKGGALKQDRWNEWANAPSLMTIPLYEKDPMVTMVDRLMLVHVMRPDRTYAAALQFVADTLGNEMPDPLVFEDLGAMLAAVPSTSPIVLVYRSAHPVRIADAMENAVVLRRQTGQSKKSALGTSSRSSGGSVVCTLYADDRLFASDLGAAIAKDAWVLIEGLELCPDPAAVRAVVATLEGAVAQWPDYSGMLVVPCPVAAPQSADTAAATAQPNAATGRVTPPSVAPHHDPYATVLSETSWPRLACNEPNTVRARMQRFYKQLGHRAVPHVASGGASTSHRVTFLLNFLVSAISQRCRYEQVAFSEPHKLATIDADVNAAALYLNKQIPSHSAKHWDELRGVARDVVGSAMRDPRDKAVVLALIDWLIHPQVATQEHLGFLHLPPSAALTAHVDAVAQLAAYDAAEHLGLHANEERRVLEREGRVLMATLCAAIRTEPPTAQTIALAAEALIQQLPAVWSAGEVLAVRSAVHGNASALSHVLAAEVDALQHVVAQLHADVQRAAALDATACSRLAPLVARSTPPPWLALTHGAAATQGAPHRCASLPVWIEALVRRNHQLVLWATEGLPRVVALGALASPAGFMHAFVFDACREASLDATQHRALLSIVPPAQAQVLPDIHSSHGTIATGGLYVVGAVLEGATLSPTGVLQDPPDLIVEWWRELAAPIPLLHLTIVKHNNSSSPSSNGSLMMGRSAGLSRVQEAISFSRANATMTRQRPSSAAGGGAMRRPPSASSHSDEARSSSAMLTSPSAGENSFVGLGSDESSGQSPVAPPAAHNFHVFSAPLYCSSHRQQDAYLCDVPMVSRSEHNYWMIRGVAIICEP